MDEEASMENGKKKPVAFVVSGVKNSGKTTLVTKLIPLLSEKGLKVATVKHDGHDFEADVPGTDSYRHFQAGAFGTAIYSGSKFSVVKRQEGLSEEDMAAFFPEADLLLYEGFKWTKYPKIEIVRSGNSEQPVCDPDTVLALATDLPLKPEGIPVYDINDARGLADVVYRYYLSAIS
jgi:molybdopterin-guanine dinucleotide biosynthesis protein B